MSGRVIGGRYELGEEIGRGGMASVFQAQDLRLGRTVAIKMLHAQRLGDRIFQGRFKREAQAAASLNHPNIVAVFDSGEDIVTNSLGTQESIPYIVMEHVDGHTLAQVLHDDGPFEPAEGARIVREVLAGLGYSHERGIVHRDIKPGNVMLTATGQVKVMDFGIARGGSTSTSTMTQTQAVVGTAHYLSPEQARGQDVDGRSDIYSTGCLLFELITGRPPFVGDSPLAIAYQHVGEDPSTPSTYNHAIPQALDAVCMHALIKDRERRYQNAAAFAKDLDAIVAGRKISPAAAGTAAALFAETQVMKKQGGTTPLGGSAAAAAAGAAAAGAAGAAGAGAAGGGVGSGGAAGDGTDAGSGSGAGSGSRSSGATTAAERRRHASSSDGPPTGEMPPIASGPRTSTFVVPQTRRRRRQALWAVLATLVLVGGALGIWRALNPATVVQHRVPGLVGLTRLAAEDALRSAQLKGSPHEQANDRPEGIVYGQSVPPGTMQAEDVPVTYYISLGPNEVSVPQVTGFLLSSAKSQITNANLVPGDIIEVDSSTVPEGQVVKTDPLVGAKVARNTRVTFYVSTGQVAVPTVTGGSSTAAKEALTAAGLTYDLKYRYSSQARGTVLEQDPVTGKLAPGSTVTLYIATPRPRATATKTPSATPRATDTSSPTSRPTATREPTTQAPQPTQEPTQQPTQQPTTQAPAPSTTAAPAAAAPTTTAGPAPAAVALAP